MRLRHSLSASSHRPARSIIEPTVNFFGISPGSQSATKSAGKGFTTGTGISWSRYTTRVQPKSVSVTRTHPVQILSQQRLTGLVS